jgi:hypothetical protein
MQMSKGDLIVARIMSRTIELDHDGLDQGRTRGISEVSLAGIFTSQRACIAKLKAIGANTA